MDPWSALTAVLVLFLLAFALGAICERFRLGALIGYLLAGTLVGPGIFGLMERDKGLEVLAEMGVSLLLFAIGLEFSLGKLKSMGAKPLLGGVLQVGLTLGFGWLFAQLFGLDATSALVVGAVVALSSTACVLPLLAAQAEMDSDHGRQSLAILLVQDLAVIVLVLLTDAVTAGGTAAETALRFGKTMVALVAMVAVFWVVFQKLLPRVLSSRGIHGNRELPIIIATASGIGSAVAAHAIGVSPAMGAFIAGMLLAESQFAAQVRADVGPLKTILLVLFFGSVGMLADLGWIGANLGLVLGVLALVLVGKAVLIFSVLRIVKVSTATALSCAVILAQTGEFGFVLMSTAKARDGISDDLFQLLVAVTIFALFLTTFLVRIGPVLGRAGARTLCRVGLAPKSENPPADEERAVHGSAVLVIGFGPAGQSVIDSFEGEGVDFHVIDTNPHARPAVESRGAHFHLGDATNPEVLEHLHVERMSVVVLTIPHTESLVSMLSHVKRMAPEAYLMVRARYDRHVEQLLEAGADTVANEESYVGIELATGLTRRVRGEVARVDHEPALTASHPID